MMNDIIRNAINEWSKVKTHDEYLAFSRKLHAARNMGVISREELTAIKEKIAEIKHENFLKMMKGDAKRLDLATKMAEEKVVRNYFNM